MQSQRYDESENYLQFNSESNRFTRSRHGKRHEQWCNTLDKRQLHFNFQQLHGLELMTHARFENSQTRQQSQLMQQQSQMMEQIDHFQFDQRFQRQLLLNRGERLMNNNQYDDHLDY